MHSDPTPGSPDTPDAPAPDAVTAHLDPNRLKNAHGRTGRMLQNAGLPFEDEEFEEDEDETSSSSSSSDESGDADA